MDAFEGHVLGRDDCDEDGAEAADADAADDGVGDETPGPAPDREWTDEEKALIVRECCWPGTRPGEVARRYGLSANQVNAWRTQARRGTLTPPFSPETEAEPEEVAQAERTLAARKAEVEPIPAASPRPSPAFAAIEVEAPPPGSVGSVSIEARGVMVRLDGDIDTLRIAEIASALRALR